MVKIIIFEDNHLDVIRRYADLIKKHDLLIYAFGVLREYFEGGSKILAQKGFDVSRIFTDVPENIPAADIYFLDSLAGDYTAVLDRLPKEKTIMITGSDSTRKTVSAQGYKVYEGRPSIEQILKDIYSTTLK